MHRWFAPDVEARSSQGSVQLSVFAPQRLYIEAAQDVRSGGWIGQQVELVAGRDVLLTSLAAAGLVRANAGRDFSLQGDSLINTLNVAAGRDVLLPTGAGDLTWIEGGGGNLTLRDPASAGTVLPMRGLTLTAGRDITVPQPVHVSDSLAITTVEATLMPTTLSAGRNVTLGRLETIGDVSLTELGAIAVKITDGAHRTPTYVDRGVPFVSVKDFSGGKLDLSSTRFIPENEHRILYQRCDPRRGDILIGRIGTLGKAVLVDTDIEFSLFVSVGLIRFDHRNLDPKFFRLLLNSPFVEAEFDRMQPLRRQLGAVARAASPCVVRYRRRA